MSKPLRPGDRITWSYIHSTGRAKFRRVKSGVYYGRIRHTIRFKGEHQLALVQFDGNKSNSKVPYYALKREEEKW